MRHPGHNLYPPTRSKAISLAWLPAAISAASKTAPEGFCTSPEAQLRLPSTSKTLLRLPLSNLHLSSNVRRHPLPRSLANGSDIQHSPLGVTTAVISLQANAPTSILKASFPRPSCWPATSNRARAPPTTSTWALLTLAKAQDSIEARMRFAQCFGNAIT